MGVRRRRPQPRMGRGPARQEPPVDQRANQADGGTGRPVRLMPSPIFRAGRQREGPPLSRSRHDHFQGCPVPAGDLRRLRHRRTPGL